MERGACHFCGEQVTTTHKAAWPISGWELEREGGGANRILGRTREPDVIAHATCAESHFRRGDQLAFG